MTAENTAISSNAELYLDLLKKSLVNYVYGDEPTPISTKEMEHIRFLSPMDDISAFIEGAKLYDPASKRTAKGRPKLAHTMVGLEVLDNIHQCLNQVLADNVPGDFIETGVFRGGVCIFMRGFLAANGCTDRTVWAADAFGDYGALSEREFHILCELQPRADRDKIKQAMQLVNETAIGIPLEIVQENFNRYGLLDHQVQFLRGWFANTLYKAPIDRLALLRMDGDVYESTIDALDALYPKLSPGGFVIVDDYHFHNCRKAIEDFRDWHNIADPIEEIDGDSVYWRRSE